MQLGRIRYFRHEGARLDPASRARERGQLELWFDPANGAHLTR